MTQNTLAIMLDIAWQFRRAQDLNMLSDLFESESLISATFCDTTKSFIIDAVVAHLNIKYGNHVFVSRSSLNPKVVEVWQKEMSA